MKDVMRWYAFLLAAVSFLALAGCAQEGIGQGEDLLGGGRPLAIYDAGAVDVGSDTRTQLPDSTVAAVDTRPAADTTPALACTKLGPFASTAGVSLPITLPTTAYCFELCPEARDPIDPLDYAWVCTGFTDADRSITVNGVQVSCAGQAARALGSVLPATVDGVWTFMLSAGGHTNDFIAWTGVLRVCP